MRYQNIKEEELKNKVGQDFFSVFDTTKIVGNIDFCVCPKAPRPPKGEIATAQNAITINKTNQLSVGLNGSLPFGEGWGGASLLWAEAKRGTYDLLTMMTQLVLTIGKARTFDKFLPPAFLGAFDSQKMGFVPYNAIMDVFAMNDFNWNVTPSNHSTKEFGMIKERIEKSFDKNHYVYDFIKDESTLQFFIKNNLARATESGKILIDKNNFVPIYLRWLDQVKPCINFDWVEGRKQNIQDSDFYLADLFVDDKGTSQIDDDTPVNDNLFVVFRNSHYEIAKENLKSLFNASIEFKDKSVYEQFWKKYKRPPLEKIQHYIIDRKDLLVPQDIRERKGAFFTPQKWVELSQKYIADVLGSDWQDDYYVWDCAAGTGNLLAGLTNKWNIWASTLDQSDVNAMHDRIENGAILLKDHCFQFDFLNDDFSKLPQGLQDIINNEEKRKKLVVYINPPYAEATSTKTISNISSVHKESVGNTKTKIKYEKILNQASKELFVQFLFRIYKEIPEAYIANFSKVKILQGIHYKEFREHFFAKLEKLFIVPSFTFDNVKGKFPVGFFVWNTKIKELFKEIDSDVYDQDISLISNKKMFVPENKNIKDWLRQYNIKDNEIGYLVRGSADVQNNNVVFITLKPSESVIKASNTNKISENNLIINAVFLTVRKIIEQTWINDRDQYLFPNDKWQIDNEFKNDCLTYSLFDQSNIVTASQGTNHWIPFTEQEVNAKEKFESNFMTHFIKGKIKQEQKANLFSNPATLSGFETLTGLRVETNEALVFSEKATNV
ncbi:MAG: hypothetical protein H7174_01445, partial [Flavobacterium sp.]|nr:hypothetical protein [Flavobacterium sp.]